MSHPARESSQNCLAMCFLISHRQFEGQCPRLDSSRKYGLKPKRMMLHVFDASNVRNSRPKFAENAPCRITMSSSSTATCLYRDRWARYSTAACAKLTFIACVYGPLVYTLGAHASSVRPKMHVTRPDKARGSFVSQESTPSTKTWSTSSNICDICSGK